MAAKKKEEEKKKEKEAVPESKLPAKATAKDVKERTSDKGRASTVRKEINSIRKDMERNYLVLAELLAEVNDKEYYLDYGFKTFAEYAEIELETKYRKAMYFVDIWKRTKELKINKSKLQQIGWTKAKEIVGVMDEENAEELMDMAREKSTKELQDAVAESYKGEGARKERTSFFKLSLKMNEAEADVITTAIEEAKKAATTENAVTALELICMEWQQQHESTTPPSLDSLIQFAKTMFGVTLVEAEGGKAAKAKGKAEKKEEEPKAKAKASNTKDVDISELSKSELRAFIAENSLNVKISRGEDADSIREKIFEALGAKKEEKEPAVKDAKKGKEKKEEPPKKAAKAEKKSSKAQASDEDDLNALLGIS